MQMLEAFQSKVNSFCWTRKLPCPGYTDSPSRRSLCHHWWRMLFLYVNHLGQQCLIYTFCLWRRERQLTPVFLPGESLWTEETGRELRRVEHDWATNTSYTFWRQDKHAPSDNNEAHPFYWTELLLGKGDWFHGIWGNGLRFVIFCLFILILCSSHTLQISCHAVANPILLSTVTDSDFSSRDISDRGTKEFRVCHSGILNILS